MKLLPIPAFTDNYIWMMHDGHRAVVVDPGDASAVTQTLDSLNLELESILVTHHHADHVGGIQALRGRLRGQVTGPVGEAIPKPCTGVQSPGTVHALGLTFEVLDVPGHTAGHIAFFCQHLQDGPVLFCGDTLFSAGCGRLFEGTASQMHGSLSLLAALPGDTRVCCAHEYTLSNLRFAQAVEPCNQTLQTYMTWCQGQRALGLPTLPSTINMELAVNPFLRCDKPDVRAAAASRGCTSPEPVEVLAALRSWKNVF